MKYFLFVFFIYLMISSNTYSALPIRYDTTTIQTRVPEKSTIAKLKKDADFNYKLEATPDDSFIQWLRYKFYKLLEIIFSDKGPAAAIRWVLIILFLVFIILKILKVSPQSLFYRYRKTASVSAGEFSEDITGLNFEQLISESAQTGDYKKAVRYMYLKLLKMLSDQNLIEWSVYKTNHDYHREMSGSSYNHYFRQLSSMFEFTWYGDFALSNATFEKIKTEFSDFYDKLNK